MDDLNLIEFKIIIRNCRYFACFHYEGYTRLKYCDTIDRATSRLIKLADEARLLSRQEFIDKWINSHEDLDWEF